MKALKTIIIDDERLGRESLKAILKDFNEIEIIDEAQSPEEGIEKIKSLDPDLIFLDVSMPGMSGFEMLKQLDEIPQVIFVTAYDEFAMKAFEVNAMDYILKPVDPERIENAIRKCVAKLEEADFASRVNVASRSERLLRTEDPIFIKDGEKTWFVELANVRFFESEGNYVKVHFENHRPMILRSLNSLEERLDPETFFRANRKFIVNIKWITTVENWFNGGLQIELKDGTKIEISRRQAIRFKELFSI